MSSRKEEAEQNDARDFPRNEREETSGSIVISRLREWFVIRRADRGRDGLPSAGAAGGDVDGRKISGEIELSSRMIPMVVVAANDAERDRIVRELTLRID